MWTVLNGNLPLCKCDFFGDNIKANDKIWSLSVKREQFICSLLIKNSIIINKVTASLRQSIKWYCYIDYVQNSAFSCPFSETINLIT